jgi:hypothetical protein
MPKDYKTLKVRDPDGKLHSSRGNGDAIHKAMMLCIAKGISTSEVMKANDLKIAKTGNPGQQRMALGAALRGIINNGGSVKIGAIRVTTLKQAIDLPAVETRAAAPKKAKKAVKKAKAVRKPRAKKAAEEAVAA